MARGGCRPRRPRRRWSRRVRDQTATVLLRRMPSTPPQSRSNRVLGPSIFSVVEEEEEEPPKKTMDARFSTPLQSRAKEQG